MCRPSALATLRLSLLQSVGRGDSLATLAGQWGGRKEQQTSDKKELLSVSLCSFGSFSQLEVRPVSRSESSPSSVFGRQTSGQVHAQTLFGPSSLTTNLHANTRCSSSTFCTHRLKLHHCSAAPEIDGRPRGREKLSRGEAVREREREI